MKVLQQLHAPEQLELVHTISKIYPKFIKVIEYKTPRLLTKENVEPDRILSKNPKTGLPNPHSFEISLRRTRTVLQDLVLCNKFDSFVTFTFSTDRYNVASCKKRMSVWLKDQSKRYGKFTYIIVPEYHKDKAIHFHALFNDYKGRIVQHVHNDKPLTYKNRPVYTVKSYRHGFTNFQFIEDTERVSSYIRKYITKSMPVLPSSKRYWTSRDLKKPDILRNYGFESMPFVEFSTEYENEHYTIKKVYCSFKILTK